MKVKRKLKLILQILLQFTNNEEVILNSDSLNIELRTTK